MGHACLLVMQLYGVYIRFDSGQTDSWVRLGHHGATRGHLLNEHGVRGLLFPRVDYSYTYHLRVPPTNVGVLLAREWKHAKFFRTWFEFTFDSESPNRRQSYNFSEWIWGRQRSSLPTSEHSSSFWRHVWRHRAIRVQLQRWHRCSTSFCVRLRQRYVIEFNLSRKRFLH